MVPSGPIAGAMLRPGRCAPQAPVRGGVVGSDFDQPTVAQARKNTWGLVRELNCVVVDVSVAVGAQRARDEGVRIDRPEGINPAQVAAIASINLEYRAAQARDVNSVIGQDRVENGLPLGELNADCFPVALEGPLLYECTILPVQPLLVPSLRVPSGYTALSLTSWRNSRARRIALDESTGLELHEHVVPSEDCHLVVDEETPARVPRFRGREGVVDDVR